MASGLAQEKFSGLRRLGAAVYFGADLMLALLISHASGPVYYGVAEIIRPGSIATSSFGDDLGAGA